MLIKILIKIPILKKLIPSLGIRLLKLLKKNRGYFKIKNIRMFLDFLHPIDREIILYQEYEKLELNFLINKIKDYKISHFFDIGSNCGYYSIIIAKEISDISITSFEPNREAYYKFIKTLKDNPILSKKIHTENFGLSNIASKLEMQSMIKHGYSQTGGTAIIDNNRYKNFDSFFGDFKIGSDYIRITDKTIAIKIDVEGHELKVLEGLKKVLQQNKAIIQIEIFTKNFETTNKYLISLGYQVFFNVTQRSNYFYTNIK